MVCYQLFMRSHALLCTCYHCCAQACHVAALVSLTALDLANNNIVSLFDSGMTACMQLQALRVSNNAIADPMHLKFFALLPALRVLEAKGNPFMSAPRARCVPVCHCLSTSARRLSCIR
jgi:hypothetical protein